MDAGAERADGGLSPFRVPGYRALLGSYAINEFGDNFALIALTVLIWDRTGSTIAVAAMMLAAKFLPALVAPFLAARLAVTPVARTLPVLYAFEALIFAALAIVAVADPRLEWLLPLAALDGLFALTARGLSRGVVATILEPAGALRRGNALLNIVFAAVSVAGPIAAFGAISIWSVGTALWIDAASFVLAGLVVALWGRGLPPAEIDERGREKGRAREGFVYIWKRPVARRLVIGQSLAVTFGVLLVPVEVAYANDALHEAASAVGLLITAWGIGILIGSGVYTRVHDRDLGLVVTLATAMIGVSYLMMAAAPVLAWALAASVFGGVGNGMQLVGVITALQESVDREFYARATSLLESLMDAVPGVAFAAGGLLAALLGSRPTYVIAGVGVVAVAISWWVWPIVPRPAAVSTDA